MNLIWATRGRTWGFRFLCSGGYEGPLPVYETLFAKLGHESQILSRQGDKIALRFPDPEGRQDRAGRVIPHDFIIFGTLDRYPVSVDEGISLVWPLVADEYLRLWDKS